MTMPSIRTGLIGLAAIATAVGCDRGEETTESANLEVTSEFRYPYRFTDERDLPDHEAVRAEGASRIELVSSGVSYFEKYFKKKYSAPHEAFPHFDAQRALFADLERTPESGPPGVRLGMVGDLMWIRDQWDTFVGDDVRRELASYGALVGNLETPIARGKPVPRDASDYLAYNAEPGLVRSFVNDGRPLFSALSIANNHTFDLGDDGARATIQFLAEEGIPSAGLRSNPEAPLFVSFTAGGIRFGYYATTFGFNDPRAAEATSLVASSLRGLAPEPLNTHRQEVDLREVKLALEAMDRERVDVKIVSAHWGHEFEYYPSPVTMQLARSIVALGADVIVGAHPHVIQPAEVCLVNDHRAGLPQPLRAHPGIRTCEIEAPGRPRKALVLYSLGNFATNMWGFSCELGMVASVEFFRDPRGAVDWRAPRHLFVHNRRRGAGGRTLQLLSTYLGEGCDGAGCSAAVNAFVAFAERHITGVHLSREEARRMKELGAREGATLEDELASFADSLGFGPLSSLIVGRLD
jgi:hypothetical protein